MEKRILRTYIRASSCDAKLLCSAQLKYTYFHIIVFLYVRTYTRKCLYRGNKDACSLPVLVSDKRPCEVVTNMVIEGKGCVESTANVEVAGIQVDSPLLAHTWYILILRCQHPGIPHYRPLSAPSTNHSAFSCPIPNIGGRICRQKERNNNVDFSDKQTLVQLQQWKKKGSDDFGHQLVAYWLTAALDLCFVLRCQIHIVRQL